MFMFLGKCVGLVDEAGDADDAGDACDAGDAGDVVLQNVLVMLVMFAVVLLDSVLLALASFSFKHLPTPATPLPGHQSPDLRHWSAPSIVCCCGQ